MTTTKKPDDKADEKQNPAPPHGLRPADPTTAPKTPYGEESQEERDRAGSGQQLSEKTQKEMERGRGGASRAKKEQEPKDQPK